MEIKKQNSCMTNVVAQSALAVIRLKNFCSRRMQQRNIQEPHRYGVRVCQDEYAPFVKPSFLTSCRYDKKDESPRELLEKSSSMAGLFRSAVEMHKNKPCVGYRPILECVDEKQPDGKVFSKMRLASYKFLSYRDLDALVTVYGCGVRAMGIQPKQNVVLLAETRFEWMCMAQALMRHNIPIVTLYATLSDEGVEHGIRETEATMVITTRELLEKFHKMFANLPQVKNIIYMESQISVPPERLPEKTLMSLFELKRLGEKNLQNFDAVEPALEDAAILMYTSGSTGVPKGVILTHKNMLSAARGLGEIFDSMKVRTDDCYVAYLPLAHVFELNCEMIAILYGVKIGYSSALTLTDNSTSIIAGQKGDCTLLQPTIMASVPLVLDRVKKSVLEKAGERGAIPQRILELAIEDAVRRFDTNQNPTIYDKDVFSKIRSVVGGKVRLVATGSAPLSSETHSFIRAALGCHVIQGYGLTETCAAATCMELTDSSTGSVGGPVGGAYVSLADWAEGGYFVRDGKGEIILGGDMIAAGYYKNPQLTEESFFEKDGIRYFRTGDIGEVSAAGTYKIIDRKKDLVKLQHGEYVSLGKVETELKTIGLVENICVYGNGLRTYLVALVQPNQKQLRNLAIQLGRPGDMKWEDLCRSDDVQRSVLEILQAHAKSCRFSRFETPQKIILCSEEWTPDSGLVTAAFKLRRKEIQDKYLQIIDKIYT